MKAEFIGADSLTLVLTAETLEDYEKVRRYQQAHLQKKVATVAVRVTSALADRMRAEVRGRK